MPTHPSSSPSWGTMIDLFVLLGASSSWSSLARPLSLRRSPRNTHHAHPSVGRLDLHLSPNLTPQDFGEAIPEALPFLRRPRRRQNKTLAIKRNCELEKKKTRGSISGLSLLLSIPEFFFLFFS